MSKLIQTTRGELVFALAIAFLLGGVVQGCMHPAHAGTSNASVYDNAERIARAVEHIERISVACAKRTSPYSACDVP